MRCPDRLENEADRLLALAEYGLAGEERASSLDPIVDIAAKMFDCPAAAVNIIGNDHVFLTSSFGIDDYDRSRDVSFCAHAITQDEVMVVEDATLDPRFHDNPIVEAGFIRFYAGVPLRTASGHALGALCVIDNKPHAQFAPEDRVRLKELAGLVLDKLELRRLQIAAASNPPRLVASAATSPNAIISFDAQSTITAWNEAATTLFGRSAEDATGRSIKALIAEEDWPVVDAGLERVLGGGEPNSAGRELTGVRANGEQFPIEIHWSRWLEGDEMHFGAIARDMTERKRDHDTLYRLANYDTLTGLPNRNLLQQKVEDAAANGSAFALIVSDLHGFTDINNTLGYAAGDSVLRLVAERIGEIGPDAGLVARIGGDEFATLVQHESDPATLERIARRINAAIARPIVVDGQEVRIVGNCGMALAPDHGNTFEELMGSAELALFQARSTGRGSTFLFMPALRADAVARRMYDAELHRAVERGEFVLFYQPQIRLAEGKLAGAEALIRWKHSVRGLLAPAAFLPALESGVLAEPTGTWVLQTACAQAAAWRAIQPDFRISVNLFSAQFRSGALPGLVLEVLAAHGLPPEALELEITENIMLDQQDTVLSQLKELRAHGVMLSFDDFGMGFASLNLLRDYPVTHIKIDKSFTQVVQTSPKDRAIVVSLIDLARQLGLGVVAEGVENAETGDFLRSLGCEKGQGYHFGRPVPAAVFSEQFMIEQTSALAC